MISFPTRTLQTKIPGSKFFSKKWLQVEWIRGYAEGSSKKGLVLGAYDGCFPGDFKLTNVGYKFDEEVNGKLTELLKGSHLKKGKAHVFTNLSLEFGAVAVAGLGPEEAGFSQVEILDEAKENVRVAAGVGAMALQEKGYGGIMVESMGDAESAAEGAVLGLWRYQDNLKESKNQEVPELYKDPNREGWKVGTIKADSQNFARRLEETPSNLMTPAIFAQKALDFLCPCGVAVDVRDKDWLENKKLAAFLSVARTSCQQPLLVELNYCGADPTDRPVVIAGKGVTFDSGGLYLKKCKNMTEWRADMAGAAVTAAVVLAAAMMNLPINLCGLVPLSENIPGGMALKPGDVVKGLNGKTIRVEDVDNEGRVILADMLTYAANFDPCLLVDLATMSTATRKSLGPSASVVFTTSDSAWKEIEKAGAETGDRVWRMPLWKHFSNKVTSHSGVDVSNAEKGMGGGACLAASFLNEFVPAGVDFMHLDITGTGMVSTGFGCPYLRKGLMTGRPTRTMAQFLYRMACPHETKTDRRASAEHDG